MRLIDADAFIVNSVKDGLFVFQTENVTDNTIFVKTVYGDLIDAINNAPTVDAAPVRHGKWEKYPDHAHFRCSECRLEFYVDRMPRVRNYCPNCGAKMDGKDTNVTTK